MDKQNLTFDQMYGRLEKQETPEKVSGRPVSRSSRAHLEQLKEQQQREQS